MGMLDRIKKRQADGFKEFVINMETTGAQGRSLIFTTGILEDPVYMSYVMKNIRTFKDFLELDSDQVEKVISSNDQVLSLFSKSLFGSEELSNLSLPLLLPRLSSHLKGELSYLSAITPAEQEGARFFILKLARKMQMEERIQGFSWTLPPQEIYLPKTIKDGPFKVFFESGILAAEGSSLKNRRTGSWRHYYDNGTLLGEGDYSEGLKFGVWIFYYSNGKMKAQGKYIADLKHGSWKEWDRSGLLVEVEYAEGVKNNP